MTDPIRILENEIGYIEKASAKDLDSKTGNPGTANYTKYARDVNEAGLMGCQAQAWCGTSQFWADMKAFGVEKALERYHMDRKSYVAYSVFETRDAWPERDKHKTPKVGDLVIFKHSHEGRVVRVYGNACDTIEGNTSPRPYERNGGMMAKKSYNIHDSKIECFLRFDDGYTPDPEWKGTAIAECTGDSVNVRNTPGMNGDILRKLNKGNRFEVNGEVSGSWTKVNVTGMIGWVSTQYVKIIETSQPSPAIPLKYTVLKITADALTVRENPSLSAKAVGTKKKGEKVDCTVRQWSEGRCWFKCKEGWVSGRYLEGWIYDYHVRKWWYVEEGYTYQISKWKWIDGKSYYFDRNGWMLHDCYIIYGDHYCWMNSKGQWEPEWDTKNPDRSKYKVYG